VINLWRIQGLTRLASFWLPVISVASVWLGFQRGLSAGAAAGGVLALTILTLTLIWPSLSWRYFRYGLRDDDLLVESGVLFRHTVSIPLDRIQHVDTRQGPIERAFGLSRLVVYTAAGMAADGAIPGLDEAHADALRDSLVRRRGDDGV
jgi:membrane protein YdbS with pleckstrin-like domain